MGSPVDIDAEVWMLPDLEADVFLGVEKIMHHFVVDLKVANGHQALGCLRRKPLAIPCNVGCSGAVDGVVVLWPQINIEGGAWDGGRLLFTPPHFPT